MRKTAGVFAALLLLLGGFTVYGQTSHEQIPYEELPRMGDADAPVKIVEFADFKCPHCKTFTEEIFPQLKEEYIDTGVVSFYFMNFPVISEDSITAGAAGAAVHEMYGNEAFWTFEEELFANQRSPRQTWATPEFLGSLAASVVEEADARRLVRSLRNNEYVDIVQRDQSIGRSLGVNGTPSILIGDTFIPDYRDYEHIRSVIESLR